MRLTDKALADQRRNEMLAEQAKRIREQNARLLGEQK